MFVLGNEDTFKEGKFPWVTTSLVLINVIVYTVQAFVGDKFTNGYALVPYEITHRKDLNGKQNLKVKIKVSQKKTQTFTVPIEHYPGPKPIQTTLLTSQFLHVNTSHLLENMWFLIIFGRNVEGLLGPWRFILFYFASGLVGGLTQIWLEPDSIVPCIGASGAISGIMAAYCLMFPLKRIAIWFSWLIGTMEFPAIGVLGFWFALQWLNGYIMMQMNIPFGTAYWVHVAGFLTGAVLLVLCLAWEYLTSEESLTPEEESLANPPSQSLPKKSGQEHQQPTSSEPAVQGLSTARYLGMNYDKPEDN